MREDGKEMITVRFRTPFDAIEERFLRAHSRVKERFTCARPQCSQELEVRGDGARIVCPGCGSVYSLEIHVTLRVSPPSRTRVALSQEQPSDDEIHPLSDAATLAGETAEQEAIR